MDKDLAEYAIFLAAQTGLLVWTLSSMNTNLKNLTSWVAKTSLTAERTAIRLATIEGRLHIDPLPLED